MRIAQVAPLYESVPPETYGGTERVVHYLTEALVDSGHEVTLFAAGDSRTRARLVPAVPHSLRLSSGSPDPLIAHTLMLEEVYRRKKQFDVFHFHVDYLHYPRTRLERIVNITTLHGKLTHPDLRRLYREFASVPVVSISNAQRRPLPWLSWQATVYHGLPLGLFRPVLREGMYLAFLGRVSPEKGIDSAIEIARTAQCPLKIAAKIDRVDQEYYDTVIRPLLHENEGLVEFVGEIDDRQKQEFLGNAKALIFPINWPEPFGLVMIEALACGTPVIAFNRGSVPEIIRNDETGTICDSVAVAAEHVRHIDRISRLRCRRDFEQRFSAHRMASEYLGVYTQLIEESLPQAM